MVKLTRPQHMQAMHFNPYLKELHSLKEEYVDFNTRNAGDPEKASVELDALIDKYLQCDHKMFHDFGRLKNPADMTPAFL